VGLTNLVNRQAAQSNPGILGSLFGGSTPEPTPAAPSPAVQTAAARVAQTPPEQKHKDMISVLIEIRDIMDDMNNTEINQLRAMRDGFSKMGGIIH